MSNARRHLTEIIGATVSGGGAVTAIATWQTQLAWGVTVSSGLVGITAGVLTIQSLLKKNSGK